jgi:hypothetical protein
LRKEFSGRDMINSFVIRMRNRDYIEIIMEYYFY